MTSELDRKRQVPHRQDHTDARTTTGPERLLHGYAKFRFEHVRLHDDPPRSRERLLPLPPPPCTTTSSTDAVYNYFHDDPGTTTSFIEPEPLRTRFALNACFEGINPEATARERMHVLYEMHHMFAPCPNCHSFAMPPSRGNPEAGSTPPSCMTRSRSLPFAPVSP